MRPPALLTALLGPASLALVAGCGGGNPTQPAPDQHVNLVLDIPNAVLDPIGYTTVEVTLHEANGDTVRAAAVDSAGRFDLGAIDPRPGVWIEAALRNDSGAAVGYGRTATPSDFADGAEIVVPVRRPIAYIAGPKKAASNAWIGSAGTASDLSTGARLDGSIQIGAKPVLVVAAGPRLYTLDQVANTSSGVLGGTASLREVSTADHTTGAVVATLDGGSMQDGAGTDDGTALVIATSTRLFVIDNVGGASASADVAVHEVAVGNFSRVATVGMADGSRAAVAIAARGSATGACATTAELWVIPDLANPVATKLATGGFTDVAADAGKLYYIDGCKGELGEVKATGATKTRGGLTTTTSRATALAVSNGQAWVGVEKPGVSGANSTPATTSLIVTPVGAGDMPRTLWTESAQQVLRATQFQGVERRLDAVTAQFQQLELGAGGDYVVATIASGFHGDRVSSANFPTMDVVTEELRVFDASTGGAVQRYRSWCEGTFTTATINDIDSWACSITTGQTEPGNPDDEHRVTSMTFLFGKK